MSCQFCGALMEKGSLVCEACGAEQPQVQWPARPAARVQAAPLPDPLRDLPAGPTCPEHAGMPLLGNCPRCQKQVCVRCAPEAVRDVLTCEECSGLGSAYKLAPAQSVCAVHPERRAVFVCARCGAFACAGCKPAHDHGGKCLKCAGVVGPLASRGDRFVANFVDTALVLLVPALAFGVLVAFAPPGPVGNKAALGFLVLAAVGSVLFGLIAQLVAQLRWGQSIGKRMTGIKVVRTDGSPIELWRLLLMRNLVMSVLGNACGLISLIDALMIFSQDQRCLHDYLADSIVIDVGPAERVG